MAGSVFISYRREDTSGFARLIYERFSQRIGKDHVFMDVDTLKPGDDYRPIAHEELTRTSVIRIDIEAWSGKQKAEAPDFPGAYRLADVR